MGKLSIHTFIKTWAIVCFVALYGSAQANSAANTVEVSPPHHIDKPWRLGYVESGIYNEYPITLTAIAKGLKRLGWIDVPENIPENLSAEEIWLWLAENNNSHYIQFVSNAYWSPGNFESDKREPMRHQISNRIKHMGDLDLIIAMGTWAGQDMRALGPPIPTIVASVSDAIGAGITDSTTNSGIKNLHARVEPQRYQRQLQLFHEIVPFERLGIVYENSESGRTYAALEDVNTISKKLNFTVVHCHALASNISSAQAEDNATECYKDLVGNNVDAVYITTHQGVNANSISNIAKILSEAGVPSFSMMGASHVHKGILLSLANANPLAVGLFHAQTIARILNGSTPESLNQIWTDPAKIALNLNTAREIGFDPPIDILLAADEIID